MKYGRKLLSLLLSLLLLTGAATVSAGADLGIYLPTEWNLDELYTGYGHWKMEYDRAMELIGQYEEFRGTLNNAENIYQFISFEYLSELSGLQGRLYTYATLGHDLNPSDPDFISMLTMLDRMAVEEAVATSFVNEEIFSLSLEERKQIFSAPIFDGFRHALMDYTDPETEPFSEDLLKTMAYVSLGQGYAERIYEILDGGELPDPVITMPDGQVLRLTEDLYRQILETSSDESFMEEASRLILSRPQPLAGTFAALLEENASQAYAEALINGYDSTREAEMDLYELDPLIYDMLIEAAHKGTEDYQRYLRTHADALGLSGQRSYHVGISLSSFIPGWASYDQAVEEVFKALEVLGEEYTGKFLAILQSGHVDVFPGETKVSDAYELQYDVNSLPWVLLNYNGDSADIGTIAHELGHAVYDAWASQYQSPLCAHPTIFTHEIASTVNEMLYYTDKMERAAGDEERLYWLENLLDMFSDSFFTQMRFAEFEDELYRTVESGAALSAKTLSDIWMELYDSYYGNTVQVLEESRYQWATIPHFYQSYYVYQYASSVCYAASIVQRIRSGEPGAAESYTDFLKSGASASPAELLKTAGINPLSEETYNAALTYYSELVDEYERMTGAGTALAPAA